MSYLLDTHIRIWSQENPKQLGQKSRRELTDIAQDRFVSAISTLEIARLIHLGLLRLRDRFAESKQFSLAELNAAALDLTHEIAWKAYNLPGRFHNDPADRVLVATARIANLTLITADDSILRYPHVKILSAKR